MSNKELHLNIIKPESMTEFIHSLIHDPDFRMKHCLHCPKHKPRYLCLMCSADVYGEVVEITIRGNYHKQIPLSELK